MSVKPLYDPALESLIRRVYFGATRWASVAPMRWFGAYGWLTPSRWQSSMGEANLVSRIFRAMIFQGRAR
jgi:hypothetical protein